MTDWSQDPDFQYLAVDRKKLQREQMPFDGKKMCWIPDDKEGFVSAEIKSSKGDEITVTTVEKKHVSTIYPRLAQVPTFNFYFLFPTIVPLTELQYSSAHCRLKWNVPLKGDFTIWKKIEFIISIILIKELGQV